MTVSNHVLYVTYDAVPAPKGASTHILQTTSALAAAVGPVTLLCVGGPGYLDGETVAPGVEARRASLPETGNFLERVQGFQAFVAGHLREFGPRYGAIQYRDVWGGLAVLDWVDRVEERDKEKDKDRREKAEGRERPSAARVALVHEINGLPSFELGYHYPSVLRAKGFMRKLRAQELACAVAADAVVTVSPVTRDYLARAGLAAHRMTVIPNGVDVDVFTPPAHEPANEVPRLLYVGTLAPWQGVATVLHAVKKVVRQRPVQVVFAGRGRKAWLQEALELAGELKILPHVEFRGAVEPDAVPALIRSADVCLAPLERTRRNTRQGCCPIKLLAYMACARPFVASDLAVVRALLPGDDCSSFLVPPGKSGALADRIRHLLSPAGRPAALALARRLRDHVADHLTWHHSNEAVVALHRRLAAERRHLP